MIVLWPVFLLVATKKEFNLTIIFVIESPILPKKLEYRTVQESLEWGFRHIKVIIMMQMYQVAQENLDWVYLNCILKRNDMRFLF